MDRQSMRWTRRERQTDRFPTQTKTKRDMCNELKCLFEKRAYKIVSL